MENGKFNSMSIKINKNNEIEKFKNPIISSWWKW